MNTEIHIMVRSRFGEVCSCCFNHPDGSPCRAGKQQKEQTSPILEHTLLNESLYIIDVPVSTDIPLDNVPSFTFLLPRTYSPLSLFKPANRFSNLFSSRKPAFAPLLVAGKALIFSCGGRGLEARGALIRRWYVQKQLS